MLDWFKKFVTALILKNCSILDFFFIIYKKKMSTHTWISIHEMKIKVCFKQMMPVIAVKKNICFIIFCLPWLNVLRFCERFHQTDHLRHLRLDPGSACPAVMLCGIQCLLRFPDHGYQILFFFFSFPKFYLTLWFKFSPRKRIINFLQIISGVRFFGLNLLFFDK